MSKMVGRKEGYENLANAIIESAVDDYRGALQYMKQHPRSRLAGGHVKELERFFHSEWYECLTDLNADFLLRKVREMEEKECT